MSRKITIALFAAVAMVQLYVPAKMILDREEVLAEGKEFLFRSQPIDPADPFRGKYITLSFVEDEWEVDTGERWTRNEDVYVHLAIDDDGFTTIKKVTKEEPAAGIDYVKAQVDYIDYPSDAEIELLDTMVVATSVVRKKGKIFIAYPFDRFYMEESKAKGAEEAYNETRIDSSKVAYAVVAIKDGEAVLKDVMINGVSVVEMVKAQEKKN